MTMVVFSIGEYFRNIRGNLIEKEKFDPNKVCSKGEILDHFHQENQNWTLLYPEKVWERRFCFLTEYSPMEGP